MTQEMKKSPEKPVTVYLNGQEFSHLKLSADPALRQIFFDNYVNNCKDNIEHVVKMAQLRCQIAKDAKKESYFAM